MSNARLSASELGPIENPDDATLFRVGLTREEFSRLVKMLGRFPNLVEMGMVGALWSEHCGYKSSKIHLKKLPTDGERVLQGPGENAGVVKISDELAAVFKIESHNHPSAVEPFHGAATGVGGIIRDIFAMGARPIALLDPLRFGPITDFYNPKVDSRVIARNRYLLNGVTAGIAFYGNCIGIPTVGGELVFHEGYSLNPLMNGLCLGIVNPREIIRASAREVGSKLVLVGAKTGRDGLQGATFASVELAEDVLSSRPAVQVGDPFLEKCLLEATLALRNHPALVAVQDLGAAGLTSSASEMAGRGGVGVRLHLERVPLRVKELSPYEIMLSESQERMLMIIKDEGLEDVYREFANWQLDASLIGEVIDEKVVSVCLNGQEIARLPVDVLISGAPILNRKIEISEKASPIGFNLSVALKELGEKRLPSDFPECVRCRNNFERASCLLVAHPNNAGKRLIWEHYDHQVQTNTVALPEAADSAILRVKGEDFALALTTDGPGHLVQIDPFIGGTYAVKEAYLNLLCSGAEPIAYTNCLNFASPEVPEVMGSFAKCVEGMAHASSALATPVVSGNVSFYNESSGVRIIPTPVIGMLGIIPNVKRSLFIAWEPEKEIFLITSGKFNLFGSCLFTDIFHENSGSLEEIDFGFLVRLKDFVLMSGPERLISSLHDVDSSGLLLSLIECTVNGVGARVMLPDNGTQEIEKHLFGYPPIGVIGTCAEENLSKLVKLGDSLGIDVVRLGRTGGSTLSVFIQGERSPLISIEVSALRKVREGALSYWLNSSD